MEESKGTIAPKIAPHNQCWVIRRVFNYNAQYWSGARKEWVNAGDVHGPKATNPKISYFRSRKSAEAALIAMRMNPND